jgi:class 3 adenylate cyclase
MVEPPVSGADIRTFLFADIRGYTRFTQQHGDDAASALTNRFAEIVGDLLPRYDGKLVEARGDEVLCVFGSARQAIRASVEIQRSLRTPQGGETVFPLGVGMGLDAGEAVPTGNGYRGAALNVAARLCSAAGPGQILATETITQLARRVDGARYLPPRVMRLKGLDAPVRVVEVAAERPLPPVPPAPRRPEQRGWLIPSCIAAAVLLLALAGAVFWIRSSSSTISIQPGSVVTIDAHTGNILNDYAVPVGPQPAPLIAGNRALWTYNANRRTLVRIDPAHHRAVERGIGVAATDLAVGAGYEWIADGVNNKLFQLQWQSGLPTTPVKFPHTTFQLATGSSLRPSESGQVTIHDGVVWATVQGTGWPHTVVAIRASDFKQLHEYQVPEYTSQIGDVESGPAGVWMENRTSGPNSGKAALAALTPTRSRPQYVSQGNYLQQGVAVSRTKVWFAGGTSPVIAELDPSPPYAWVPVDTPHPVTAIAAGPAGIWAATSNPGTVYQINPNNQHITRTVKVDGYVTGLAVGTHNVWVLVQSNPVTA